MAMTGATVQPSSTTPPTLISPLMSPLWKLVAVEGRVDAMGPGLSYARLIDKMPFPL